MKAEDLDSRLRRALTRRHRGRVSGVATRHVIDSTGDPAVWIWVILKDDSLLERDDRTVLESIRATAEETARAVGKEWPYVTFRTEDEQREVEEEAKRK